MNKEVIPVFFTIDNGYAPYLDVALYSLIKNASKAYHYEIIILYQGVSEENKKRLLAHSTPQFEIRLVHMEQGLGAITDRIENRLRCDYFTLTIYFRLFIPEMFPEYDKGIYLDSDIVVTGDISQLYYLKLGEHLIGACPDHSVVDIPELGIYMEGAIGIDKHDYINSGVLLMNLKQMRAEKFGERFLYLLNTYHFDCIAPDQDYLNAMCHGKILYLEEVWDAMPVKGREPLPQPYLIHYNLFEKPWCYDQIPYEEYFWHYAKQSAFYEAIKAFKDNYSEAQKKSDSECLALLIYKAGTMPSKDITFKKVLESGEQVRL